MKIKYEFVTGATEVEVSEEWGSVLIDLDREEYNNNHRETRRHCSLDNYIYEGMDFAAEDNALTELLGRDYQEDELYEAISKLKPQQQELIHKIFFEGYTANEYAAMCGVGKSAISRRISRIKNYLKKFLQDVNF